MSKYNISDDEYDSDDYDVKEFNKIKHLSLEDYLDCPQTNAILKSEWEDQLTEKIEDKVEDFFQKYYDYFKHADTRLFSRAKTHHSSDLFSLVKHHLIRDYNLEIFKSNPTLAQPLVNSIDRIKQDRIKAHRQYMQGNFSSSNNKFSWHK